MDKMIVLDSSFIIAYKIKNDKHHEKALEIMVDIAEGKYGMPIISDYIFDEIVTVILNKASFQDASEIGNMLIISADISYMDKDLFNNSWKTFQDQENTKLSFTDCSILTLMKNKGIKQIATFDKDFSKIKDIEVIL